MQYTAYNLLKLTSNDQITVIVNKLFGIKRNEFPVNHNTMCNFFSRNCDCQQATLRKNMQRVLISIKMYVKYYIAFP